MLDTIKMINIEDEPMPKGGCYLVAFIYELNSTKLYWGYCYPCGDSGPQYSVRDFGPYGSDVEPVFVKYWGKLPDLNFEAEKYQASKLISVKDKLPEDGVVVLTVNHWDSYEDGYIENGIWWNTNAGEHSQLSEIEYWMPLPKKSVD